MEFVRIVAKYCLILKILFQNDHLYYVLCGTRKETLRENVDLQKHLY